MSTGATTYSCEKCGRRITEWDGSPSHRETCCVVAVPGSVPSPDPNFATVRRWDYLGDRRLCTSCGWHEGTGHRDMCLIAEADRRVSSPPLASRPFPSPGALTSLAPLPDSATTLPTERGRVLAKAVGDLLDACGISANLCGVTDRFSTESAVELLNFAARLVRKSRKAPPPAPSGDKVPRCPKCGTAKLLCPDGHVWNIEPSKERAGEPSVARGEGSVKDGRVEGHDVLNPSPPPAPSPEAPPTMCHASFPPDELRRIFKVAPRNREEG